MVTEILTVLYTEIKQLFSQLLEGQEGSLSSYRGYPRSYANDERAWFPPTMQAKSSCIFEASIHDSCKAPV
jgi:hypothetical protein